MGGRRPGGGAGRRPGFRGIGGGGPLVYSAQRGYASDINPTPTYTTLVATKVSSLVDAKTSDDYVQAVDASRFTYATAHAALGNRPALLGNGAASRLTIAAIAGRAELVRNVYAALDITTIASTDWLWECQTGRQGLLIYTSRYGVYDSSSRLAASAAATGAQILSWQIKDGAGLSEVWRGSPGASMGTITVANTAVGGQTSIGATFPGSSGWFDGAIGRILFYETAGGHLQAEREAIQAQLALDYGAP